MELYNKEVEIDNVEDIEGYFKDCGRELFEGDPYGYETEAYTVVKIEDKYYGVTVEVTMVGERQDYGDKIYHVESIDNIIYKELDYELLKNNFNSRIMNEVKIKENEINTLTKQLILDTIV